MKRWIEFKNFHDHLHLFSVSPVLVMIMADMGQYMRERGSVLEVSSVIRSHAENVAVGSKSDTHVTGRAFDVRVKSHDVFFWDEFAKHFNEKYEKQYGAFSLTQNRPVLCVWKTHDHHDHIHVQIHRKYEVEDAKKQ
jgi:hypothetical protein